MACVLCVTCVFVLCVTCGFACVFVLCVTCRSDLCCDLSRLTCKVIPFKPAKFQCLD